MRLLRLIAAVVGQRPHSHERSFPNKASTPLGVRQESLCLYRQLIKAIRGKVLPESQKDALLHCREAFETARRCAVGGKRLDVNAVQWRLDQGGRQLEDLRGLRKPIRFSRVASLP